MDRIDGDANAGGFFTEGDPAVPAQPTQVTASWLNDVQEEIVETITTAGLALSRNTPQLKHVLANLTVAQVFTAAKTFANGLIASMPNGALGYALRVTGADGATGGIGANFGFGQDAIRGVGGVNVGGPGVTPGRGADLEGGAGTGIAGGAAANAVGGASNVAVQGGPGLTVSSGADPGGFGPTAVLADHGDLVANDGGLSVSKSVVAIGTGSSLPGPASTALSLNASVNAFAGFGGPGGITPGVWKDAFGVIHLEGSIVHASSSSYVAATLAVGFRSASGKRISCGQRHRMTSAHQGIVTILENGDLQVDTDANGVTIDLSGITFR